jgi:hypothetical protein
MRVWVGCYTGHRYFEAVANYRHGYWHVRRQSPRTCGAPPDRQGSASRSLAPDLRTSARLRRMRYLAALRPAQSGSPRSPTTCAGRGAKWRLSPPDSPCPLQRLPKKRLGTPTTLEPRSIRHLPDSRIIQTLSDTHKSRTHALVSLSILVQGQSASRHRSPRIGSAKSRRPR